MTTTGTGTTQALVTKKKKHFIGLPAPSGYTAGVGRGATGFTTRSDIGPARESNDVPDERHLMYKKTRDDSAPEGGEEEEDLNDSNYDEFSGYGGNLCSKDPYEKDDEEADKIYDSIDVRMDERRKSYREKLEKEEIEQFRMQRPKIQQQFMDLKRKLSEVTEEEWMSIPEVGDARNKRHRNPRPERFTPLPDAVYAQTLKETQVRGTVDARNQGLAIGDQTPQGLKTPGGASSVRIDMVQIGQARASLMNSRLSQCSDNVSGQTVVDPKGYLTDLHSMLPQSVGTINTSDSLKARLLFEKMRESNPHNAPAWIASVRFEEASGRIQTARELAVKGCENCPQSEDMYLEACRLLPIDQARRIVAKAVRRHLPQSVRLWVKAADMETDNEAKKAIYKCALERVPNSVRLWKLAVELEEEDGARKLLQGAVLFCPTSVELWLALAHLETYDNAKDVLNRAREKLPKDRQIWLTACRLEEANGEIDKVYRLVRRAVEVLKNNGVEINRDHWISDAQEMEKSAQKSTITARAIIKNVIGLGLEDQDRKQTWLRDAETCVENGAYECARAIYAAALEVFPAKKGIWVTAAQFEKQFGTRESYEKLLQSAVQKCPGAEVLWLMGAKSKWESNDVPAARQVLHQGFQANPNSEEILLAAIKLESENDQFDRARRLLQRARSTVSTPRVWMKSVRLEWCLSRLNEAEELALEGIRLYPNQCPKLWMMLGQIREQAGNSDGALEAYIGGKKKNSNSIPLWTLQASLEEVIGSAMKARCTLETARIKNPKNDELWHAAVKLEMRCKNKEIADNLLSRGLRECPTSGLLWSLYISMGDRSQRKTRAFDALKKCQADPHVLLGTVKVFWALNHVVKTREWLKQTVKSHKKFGDAWAYFYKFESINGTQDELQDVVQKCIVSDPNNGEVWCQVSKDVKNWRLKARELLPLVASILPVPT